MTKGNQVIFKESIYYSFDIPDGYLSVVKPKDKVSVGKSIIVDDKKSETVYVESFGKVLVKKDDKVNPGDILCEKKGLVKSEKIKCEVSGIVLEINDGVIAIRVYSPELQIEKGKMFSPFDGVVENIDQGKIIIKFSGLQLNLISSKGPSSIGKILYEKASELEKKQKDIQDKYADTIIITDKVESDIYPKLSAIGALGIVTNSINYELYKRVAVLEVPFGVISGFGGLIEDETLVEWIKSINGQTAWFDGILNRIVIPTDKCPKWIKSKK